MTTITDTRARTECAAPDCQRDREGRSRWCSAHRSRLRRYGSLQLDKPIGWKNQDHCDVKLCQGEHKARGLCQTHLTRKLLGDVDAENPVLSPEALDGQDIDTRRAMLTPTGKRHQCSWNCARETRGEAHCSLCGRFFHRTEDMQRHLWDETKCVHPMVVGLAVTGPLPERIMGMWYDPARAPEVVGR